MRLSDIYRRKDKGKESADIKEPVEQKKPPPEETRPVKPPPKPPLYKIGDKDKKIIPPKISDKVEDIYNRVVRAIKKQFINIENKNLTLEGDILSVVGDLLFMVRENRVEPIFLFEKATPDVYLYGHSVNVCILSLVLGREFKLKDNQMAMLAWGSLFHDLGILFSLDLALMPRALNETEYERIKQHPQQGYDLWLKFPFSQEDIKEKIGNIILEHHERANGSGYPKGLKEEEIDPLAKIVGLIDTYETMTHPRSWRGRFIPHEAIKRLVEQDAGEFDRRHIKSLMNLLSFYPLGSFVRLSTNEIARVVDVNEKQPTRPVVEVVVNSQGTRCEERRVVNLVETPVIYIKDAVDENRLEIEDKELALALRMSKWWVKDSF